MPASLYYALQEPICANFSLRIIGNLDPHKVYAFSILILQLYFMAELK